MSGGVTVTGGSGGISAQLEDLDHAYRLFSSAADQVGQVTDVCRGQEHRFAAAPFTDDVHGALAVEDALRSACSGLNHVQTQLRATAQVLNWAVNGYGQVEGGLLEGGESTVATWFGGAVRLTIAAGDSGRVFMTRGPSAAAQTFLTDDPALVGASVKLARLLEPYAIRTLKQLAESYFQDGHSVVTAQPDPRHDASAPPRSLVDLIAGLGVRASGQPGEIDIKILTSPHGTRHVIVDVPGTRSWALDAHTPDVAGLATNIRALGGEQTSYERGVLDAMQRAGVRPSDDVMIVGHSLGGMIAVTAAREAVRSGRFNVTHVVTAGAPIAGFVGQLPRCVQVLALENEHDVVPQLDGEPNPDRPNITTVTFDQDHGTIGADHSIDTSYEPGAARVQTSQDPSIRAYLSGVNGFFDAATVQTHVYVVTRS